MGLEGCQNEFRAILQDTESGSNSTRVTMVRTATFRGARDEKRYESNEEL